MEERKTIYDLLLEQRTIILEGEINQKQASTIVAMLDYLNCKDNTQPIKMIINSPGGDIAAGLAIYDMMRRVSKLGSPVYTMCVGMAASMGAVLLSAGTKRLATENSTIMIHQALQNTHDGYNTIFEQRERLEILEKYNQKCVEILAKNSHKTVEEIEKVTYKKDVYMFAKEAKEFGLIDEVVDEENDK